MRNVIKQIILIFLVFNLSRTIVDGDIFDFNFPSCKENSRLLTSNLLHAEGMHSVSYDEIFFIDHSKDNVGYYSSRIEKLPAINSILDEASYRASIWQPPKLS